MPAIFDGRIVLGILSVGRIVSGSIIVGERVSAVGVDRDTCIKAQHLGNTGDIGIYELTISTNTPAPISAIMESYAQ